MTTHMLKTSKMPSGISGRLVPEDARKVRYRRRIIRDGFEYDIPHSLAKYLVENNEALEQSTRSNPVLSYTGLSKIWREVRA